MRYFDLHCDTLYRALTDGKTLNEPSYHLSSDMRANFDDWTQVFALWIPDDIRGEAAVSFFISSADLFYSECNRLGITTDKDKGTGNNTGFKAMLSVENGSVLAGKISNIDLLKDYCVRILTLTWNAGNEIGSGADVTQGGGLTPFGVNAVKKLEDAGIVIDISHANRKLFDDVASIARRPFIATHSDSYTVNPHRRNLTDEQFTAICRSGGIVGLNFCNSFLNTDADNAEISDIIRHADRFISLGGEDSLCIGSDFDGTDVPYDLQNAAGIPKLYNAFANAGYSRQLVQKIFYDNAQNFFRIF